MKRRWGSEGSPIGVNANRASTARRHPIILVEMIRFACAVAVMSMHYLTAFWITPSPDSAAALAGVPPLSTGTIAAGRFGWVGVEIFFVISGMMITASLEPGVDGHARERTDMLAFGRKRVLRLAPAAWICASLTAICLIADVGYRSNLPWRWLRSVVFWPLREQIDPSYWTLGIEVAFYVLVALGLRGRSHRAWMTGIATGLAWASAAYWLLWAAGLEVMSANRKVQLLLLSHGCFFAAGIMVEGWSRHRTRPSVLTCMALVIGCALEIDYHALERALANRLPAEAWIPVTVILLALVALALARTVQPLLEQVVAADVARAVGRATYTLYLLHQEAGAITVGALCRVGVATPAAVLLTALIACAAAWLLSRWMEPPVAMLLRRAFAWLDLSRRLHAR